jgi:hypothetical protein
MEKALVEYFTLFPAPAFNYPFHIYQTSPVSADKKSNCSLSFLFNAVIIYVKILTYDVFCSKYQDYSGSFLTLFIYFA